MNENISSSQAIGIDIGGTKIAAGLVSAEGKITHKIIRPTPNHEPRAVEAAIEEAVRELLMRCECVEVHAVGVGAAGWMDRGNATVLFSPHLAWRKEPLRKNLEGLLDRSVLVMNDADAAATAEYRFGAGASESRLVVITLGTGIGGAIVNDGVIERGRWGIAGEFGHQILVPQGQPCECGNRGCWEQYASGNALGRLGREFSEANAPFAVPLIEASRERGQEVNGSLVTELAKDGDPFSQEIIAEVGQWLGIGLANLCAALDPGRFVIGGGLSTAGDLLLEPARQSLAKNLTGRGYRPVADVVGAQLGPDAGIIGAAEAARRELAQNARQ